MEAGQRQEACVSWETWASHSLGLAGASRGNTSCPTSHWPGREETSPEEANAWCTRVCAHAATLRLTPGCRQAGSAWRAGEGGGQRPTLGGRGSQLGITLSRKAAQNTWMSPLEVNTWDTTRITGTNLSQAVTEGDFLEELFPALFALCVNTWKGWICCGCRNIMDNQVYCSRPIF